MLRTLLTRGLNYITRRRVIYSTIQTNNFHQTQFQALKSKHILQIIEQVMMRLNFNPLLSFNGVQLHSFDS